MTLCDDTVRLHCAIIRCYNDLRGQTLHYAFGKKRQRKGERKKGRKKKTAREGEGGRERAGEREKERDRQTDGRAGGRTERNRHKLRNTHTLATPRPLSAQAALKLEAMAD